MDNEKKLFIQVLKDYIHGEETVSENYEIHWDTFLEYAASQSLTGIAYAQLKNFFQSSSEVPEQIRLLFRRGFMWDIILCESRDKELKELAGKMNVPIVLMKGMIVRKYYPDRELRSMGDIDFVIHTSDRKKTDQVMLEAGYDKMVDNHAVWTYSKGNFRFEIHDHMFYEYLSNDIDYRGYFDEKIWKHIEKSEDFELKNIVVPEKNLHFLYIVTHLAKHITNKGMGFRTFLDLVFMCREVGEEMDWKWIEEELDKLKLLDFTKTCFALCERWFDVKMPIKTEKLDEAFFEAVTEKMFDDGTFGHENKENDAAHCAKEIKKSRFPYWLTAVMLTWRKIFPPYRDMQLIPYYKFVDGRPWLMPAAWVYRWFYTMKYKAEHSRNLLIEPFTKKKTIEKREKLIRDWGL